MLVRGQVVGGGQWAGGGRRSGVRWWEEGRVQVVGGRHGAECGSRVWVLPGLSLTIRRVGVGVGAGAGVGVGVAIVVAVVVALVVGIGAGWGKWFNISSIFTSEFVPILALG